MHVVLRVYLDFSAEYNTQKMDEKMYLQIESFSIVIQKVIQYGITIMKLL